MTKRRLVVVVSGASRGIGRGVATALGSRGATVYVVGRSRQGGERYHTFQTDEALTIDDVAAEITAAGGEGIPVACDMADDGQIEALFARVRQHSGYVDILVNNAAFLHRELHAAGLRFWEKPVQLANIIDVGLRCHYVASWHAIQLMLKSRSGLIVNMSFYGHAAFHDPAYYASKAGLDAMAATAAPELAAAGISIVSLWPGAVATERVKTFAQRLEGRFPVLETPQFIGNTVAALYNDPQLAALSGKTLIAAELAERYGLKDVGEQQPVSYRNRFGAPHPANDLQVAD